jgi:hypothetical protein
MEQQEASEEVLLLEEVLQLEAQDSAMEAYLPLASEQVEVAEAADTQEQEQPEAEARTLQAEEAMEQEQVGNCQVADT